jgi:hypothetical protein
MRPMLLGVLLAFLPAEAPADAAWCGQATTTGYVRTDYGPHARTFDGTSILTAEPIAAASWDVRLGSIAVIDGVGSFRIADRGGGLGNGSPRPWVDVAVWDRAEAHALTGIRRVCFRRPGT